MNNISEKLQYFLRKPHSLKHEAGRLILNIDDCSSEEFQSFKEFIMQITEQDSVDYSRYFDAVKALPTYKPANPQLALLHVAKKYKLDIDAFKKAFLSQ